MGCFQRRADAITFVGMMVVVLLYVSRKDVHTITIHTISNSPNTSPLHLAPTATTTSPTPYTTQATQAPTTAVAVSPPPLHKWGDRSPSPAATTASPTSFFATITVCNFAIVLDHYNLHTSRVMYSTHPRVGKAPSPSKERATAMSISPLRTTTTPAPTTASPSATTTASSPPQLSTPYSPTCRRRILTPLESSSSGAAPSHPTLNPRSSHSPTRSSRLSLAQGWALETWVRSACNCSPAPCGAPSAVLTWTSLQNVPSLCATLRTPGPSSPRPHSSVTPPTTLASSPSLVSGTPTAR